MRLWNAAFLCVACSLPALGSPIYQVTIIGSLGGSSITPSGINRYGQVSGTATNSAGDNRAFFYDGAALLDLGSSVGYESRGGGLNDAGVVTGTSYTNSGSGGFLWASGAATPLPTLGGAGGWATSVNNLGEIAGAASDSRGNVRATVTRGGNISDLGTLSGGSWSSAYAINDLGHVVGYGDTSGGAFRGFVWSPEAGMMTLGTLGGANSYATTVNTHGAVAGHASTQSGYFHAFLFDGNRMIDLNPYGPLNSYAYGINSAGNVVGYSQELGSFRSFAFLYTRGGMVDLNTLISPDLGLELIAAYGVNDNGQITGSALRDGRMVAYRLDPLAQFYTVAGEAVISNPEPGTAVLMLLGAAALGLARVCRNHKAPNSH